MCVYGDEGTCSQALIDFNRFWTKTVGYNRVIAVLHFDVRFSGPVEYGK